MKQFYIPAYLSLFLLLHSCAPKVLTSIAAKHPPLDYSEHVHVFYLDDPYPSSFQRIGEIKIGDTGFSTNCSWHTVIENAKMEARKAGANAVKITSHMPPDIISTCHRIKASLLIIENREEAVLEDETGHRPVEADYALLHVYRPAGNGFLVNYDLCLDDSVICRVSNNFRTTIKLKKEGPHMLWARTESKSEIPINIQYGKEYYLHCGLMLGVFVGRPYLELCDHSAGWEEFRAVKSANKMRSILTVDDGRRIECNIIKQEDGIIYFTMMKDGREIETHIDKNRVKEIVIN